MSYGVSVTGLTLEDDWGEKALEHLREHEITHNEDVEERIQITAFAAHELAQRFYPSASSKPDEPQHFALSLSGHVGSTSDDPRPGAELNISLKTTDPPVEVLE